MISKWLIIVSLGVGAGVSNFIGTTSTETTAVCPIGQMCRIENHCIINGTERIPCPEDYDPTPEPSPELQPPG